MAGFDCTKPDRKNVFLLFSYAINVEILDESEFVLQIK